MSAQDLARRFRREVDPSFDGIWREACDLLDELVAIEPAVVPLDPEDLDRIPPADLDACDHCSGTGAIWDGRDPQTGDVCPVCKGDGVLPEYLGGAA